MHSAYGTRLLSIGEIFDRAVHLTIANLLPLTAIVGLVFVPARAVTDWLSRDGYSRYFGVLGKIAADPRLLASYFSLMHDPNAKSVNWPSLIWFVFALIPMTLALAAASIASQAILKGESLKLGTAYRIAARRLAQVIGASFLTWAASAALIIAAVVAVSILWIIWVVILSIGGGSVGSSSVAGLTAALVLSLIAAVALLAPLADCTFAGAALNVVRPFQALREAWIMTMSRGLLGRSLALGAAILALTVAQLSVSSAVCGVLADVTHSTWLSFVAQDSISLLATIFGAALAVSFYLDARNRSGLIQDPLAERENA